MKTLSMLFLSSALSVGALACDKKSGSDTEAEAMPDRMQPATEVTLSGLDNLKIDIAKDTEPSPMGAELMIISMDESFTVGAATSSTPATLEDAKKRATERDKGTAIKSEVLNDGWLISYEAQGSLGVSYYLTVRRTIGGKDYVCHTSVGHKSLRDGAAAACKSLRQ